MDMSEVSEEVMAAAEARFNELARYRERAARGGRNLPGLTLAADALSTNGPSTGSIIADRSVLRADARRASTRSGSELAARDSTTRPHAHWPRRSPGNSPTRGSTPRPSDTRSAINAPVRRRGAEAAPSRLVGLIVAARSSRRMPDRRPCEALTVARRVGSGTSHLDARAASTRAARRAFAARRSRTSPTSPTVRRRGRARFGGRAARSARRGECVGPTALAAACRRAARLRAARHPGMPDASHLAARRGRRASRARREIPEVSRNSIPRSLRRNAKRAVDRSREDPLKTFTSVAGK